MGFMKSDKHISYFKREKLVRIKDRFKMISAQLRQIKKDKAKAYRESRIKDAKQLEKDQSELSHLAHGLCWSLANNEIHYLLEKKGTSI